MAPARRSPCLPGASAGSSRSRGSTTPTSSRPPSWSAGSRACGASAGRPASSSSWRRAPGRRRRGSTGRARSAQRAEERCAVCLGLRLRQAAAAAAGRGLRRFSTTLTVSPYQRHDLIVAAGEAAASRARRRLRVSRPARLVPRELRREPAAGPVPPAVLRLRGQQVGSLGAALDAEEGRVNAPGRVAARPSLRPRPLSPRRPGTTICPKSSSRRRLRNPATRRDSLVHSRAAARLDDRVFRRPPELASRGRRAGAQRHARLPGAELLPPRDRRPHRGAFPATVPRGWGWGAGGGGLAEAASSRGPAGAVGGTPARSPARPARSSPARRWVTGWPLVAVRPFGDGRWLVASSARAARCSSSFEQAGVDAAAAVHPPGI